MPLAFIPGPSADWRRTAIRNARCADLFLSACARAAVILFWLLGLT